jgi:hypothetical protein
MQREGKNRAHEDHEQEKSEDPRHKPHTHQLIETGGNAREGQVEEQAQDCVLDRIAPKSLFGGLVEAVFFLNAEGKNVTRDDVHGREEQAEDHHHEGVIQEAVHRDNAIQGVVNHGQQIKQQNDPKQNRVDRPRDEAEAASLVGVGHPTIVLRLIVDALYA